MTGKKIAYLNYGEAKKAPQKKGVLEMKPTKEGWTHLTFTEFYFWDISAENWERTRSKMKEQITTMNQLLKK